EGFCIPVIEAMACGLPVVAACAAALPETVADAGLTFAPEDPAHLARQIRAVLETDRETGRQGALAEQLRRAGLERAASFDRTRWRDQFGEVVETLLDAEPRAWREEIDVRPRASTRRVRVNAGTILIPVRVVNRGTHAVTHHGPARHVLRCRVQNAEGQTIAEPTATALPSLLVPGRAISAALAVPVPTRAGSYEVAFWAERAELDAQEKRTEPSSPRLRLVVESERKGKDHSCPTSLLDAVQTALVEAQRLQQLPDDYLDVTEGLLANWKRRGKKKDHGGFKKSYVVIVFPPPCPLQP